MLELDKYRQVMSQARGQELTDQEWAEIESWLDDMASASGRDYRYHALWLAEQIAQGFRPELHPQALPITTQVLQWQWAEMGRAIEGMATSLTQFWQNVKESAEAIAEYFQPAPEPAADPPPAKPEARNENRPRQKYESPRWQPRRRK